MKKGLLILMAVSALLVMGACGNKAEIKETAKETETVGEDIAVVPETGNANTESETETAKEVSENVVDNGYVFVYKDVEVIIDAPAENIISALGEPEEVLISDSCAFDGEDKRMDYGSFVINTYQIDGVDYIGEINLKDDMVETKEGLSLFQSFSDMVDAYGNDYNEEDTGLYAFNKGEMTLRIQIEDDEISSIQFRTNKY